MPVHAVTRFFVVVVLGALLSGCAQELRPGEALVPDGAQMTHRAVLIGSSLHDTVGTISLYQSDEPAVVVFEPNFRFADSPGTVVALGSDGCRPETVLGSLLKNNGRQAYAVPSHLNIRAFNEIWLWNTQSDKPLGLGRLTQL